MWETVWSGIGGVLNAMPFLEWWIFGCGLVMFLLFFFAMPMLGGRMSSETGGWFGVIVIGAILGLVLWLIYGGEGSGKATNPERESTPRYSAQKNPERESIPRYSARTKKGRYV
jgi:amino acid transporter